MLSFLFFSRQFIRTYITNRGILYNIFVFFRVWVTNSDEASGIHQIDNIYSSIKFFYMSTVHILYISSIFKSQLYYNHYCNSLKYETTY